MAKKKSKTKATKHPNFKQYVSKNRYNILISSLFILIALGFLLQPFYRDWENARFIRGLARDFPVLIAEIEDTTSLDLEITSNCSRTTEKFTNGVNTCEISIAKAADNLVIERAQEVVINSESFTKSKMTENQRGYNVNYMNKNSCVLSNGQSVYFSCLTTVRKANAQLAIEEFSKITENQ